MAGLNPFALLPVLLGAALLAGGLLAIRASGAQVRLALRLAGARQVRVGDLLGAGDLPVRPVRIIGRIRCPDPIVTAEDDRLVALHRDVQVALPDGRWRTIERIRETRGFELWDHDGSLPLDPADAAEPLVVIPHVWRGSSAELEDPGHRAAISRLVGTGTGGVGHAPARSVTRMLSVVERLLVLARARRTPDGGVELVPPPGGYVIAGLDLPDAMRLLGGQRRGLMLTGAAVAALGVVALLAGILVGLAGLLG